MSKEGLFCLICLTEMVVLLGERFPGDPYGDWATTKTPPAQDDPYVCEECYETVPKNCGPFREAT